ncbi:CST complex subunit CTC1 [Larimichthys crocea]|nr:CST complex subunit CTC1 [Larimichthys crocea]
MKRSRVISYQGTVTEVVSEGAGLYVIDRKVGLCLAYQPTLRRTMRAGDSVELHHVHFLYRPCPDFSPSMLCTCLRSSIRVTAFSRVERSSPDSSCPGDGVLPRLLLEKNLGVSEYLWTCHLSSQLANRTVTSDPQNNHQTGDRLRQRPLLLVGVLELPSQTSEQTLQLRDGTGAVACVVTETSEGEEGGQRAAFNTAWIGI